MRLPAGRAALGEVGKSVFQRPDGTAGDGGEPPWADRSGVPWRVAEERTQVAGPQMAGAGEPPGVGLGCLGVLGPGPDRQRGQWPGCLAGCHLA